MRYLIPLLLSTVLGHAAQTSLPAKFEFTEVHMGLPVRLTIHATTEDAARRAASAAFTRIKALDDQLSDYRPESTISEIARRAPAPVAASADAIAVVSQALAIARETQGAFDPTAAPVVTLWREARASNRLPAPQALARARQLVDWRAVEVDPAQQTIRLRRPGMRLDLGGIAKGYVLQEALRTLGREGVQAAMAAAGGDVVTMGVPPGREGWRVDVPSRDAFPPAFVARASALNGQALSTSGPTAQYLDVNGVRYSHVVDPRTGRALTSGFVAHVIAGDAALADALATAATVVGPDGLADLRRRFPGAQIELIRQGAAVPATGVPGDRAAYEWAQLFNGRDLTDWTPKFARHPLGLNLLDTFRVVDGLLQVRYDKWSTFDGEFGHLFYRQPYSHYLIAAEYRFVGEQLPAARSHGWAVRNNGFMLHSQDPATMVRDQDFPISMEVQFLGGLGTGARPTANLCTPGTHVVMNGQLRTAHCTNSTSRTFDGDGWVRVEVLVLGHDLVRHLVNGETVMEYTQPQIGGGNVAPSDPAVKVDGTPLSRGFIAIQAETAPIDFRKIEIVNLEGCADPASPRYRSYVVKHNAAMCR